MINAATKTDDGRSLLLVGLTKEDVAKMLGGKPICFRGEELQLANLNVWLFAAEDVRSLINTFQSYLGPDAVMVDRNGGVARPFSMIETIKPQLLEAGRRARSILDDRRYIAMAIFTEYWSRAPATLTQFGFPDWNEYQLDELKPFFDLADEVRR